MPSILFYFLSITVEKEYDTKKKACLKIPTIKDATNCRTLKGIARTKYDTNLEQYCGALFKGVNQLEELFKK